MSDWGSSGRLGDGRETTERRSGAVASQVWPREAPRVLLGVAVLERWGRALLALLAASPRATRRQPLVQPARA